MKKALLAMFVIASIATGCDKITDLLTVKAFYNSTAFTETDCEQLAGVRSDLSTDSMNITFVNNSERELHINWIDLDGSEVSYFDLADGASVDVPTYKGHAWIVRLTNNGCSTILKSTSSAGQSETVSFGAE